MSLGSSVLTVAKVDIQVDASSHGFFDPTGSFACCSRRCNRRAAATEPTPRSRPANGAHAVIAIRPVLSRAPHHLRSPRVSEQAIAMLLRERCRPEVVHEGLLFSNIGLSKHRYVRARHIGSPRHPPRHFGDGPRPMVGGRPRTSGAHAQHVTETMHLRLLGRVASHARDGSVRLQRSHQWGGPTCLTSRRTWGC